MFRTRVVVCFLLAGCAAPSPAGLGPTPEGDGPLVTFDPLRTPLPELPLPNDFAARFDGSSPTLKRLNAAIAIAPTQWERAARAGIDSTSGWGTLAPLSVPFEAPLDLENIVRRHQRPTDFDDDVLYVFDVTRGSPDFCRPQPLDLGQGHFPIVGDEAEYYPDEPHSSLQSLLFEQEEEDLDGDGVLDPGEDTDMDGVLDHPNVRDGRRGPFDVIGFYEKETNTLLARPLVPYRESTTYAVVLTKRLVGLDGQPVRSPFSQINHLAQTPSLKPITECLAPYSLGLDDVAFTWSFTTQSLTADYVAFRDGLYGTGPLAFLGTQYPAQLNTIPDGRRPTSANRNTKAVPGSQFLDVASELLARFGGTDPSTTQTLVTNWLSQVGFYASATFISPQLFPRTDADGKLLPLWAQVMDDHVGIRETFHRPETIPIVIAVPKARTGPAPVAIFLHGHSGSKLDSVIAMGPFARAGMATIGMDAVSHGFALTDVDRELVTGLLSRYGVEPLANAIIGDGRAIDQNGDGLVDPGADYFTAYPVHTRDVVRQTIIDLMQLIRVLRSFDGVNRWAFDVNRDGQPDLAGDFDGDGVVDLGGPNVPIYVSGASLGGILASLLGGLEPNVEVIAPILPGGYLSEVGLRSTLGQVRNPLALRLMAPLLLVHPNDQGKPALFQMVPDLTKVAERQVAVLPAALKPGSLAVVRNLKTGEWRCARAQANGHLRVAVSSDQEDPLQIQFYDRELPSHPREGCDPTGVEPVLVIDHFESTFEFQGQTREAETPLVALGDGFGFRRASPELRRMFAFSQIILEQADPANFAPNWERKRVLRYGDGSEVATRALLLPMTGDPGVPIATATALMRAGGLIDFENVDPRYGKTPMQQLIDVGLVEGVERTGRYQNPRGLNVLMDVDVLQNVNGGNDGFNTPRMNPPLRAVRSSEALGGQVGALFPMMNPFGEHSLPLPDPANSFDLGTFVIDVFSDYLASGGTRVSFDPCMVRSDCDWLTKTQ